MASYSITRYTSTSVTIKVTGLTKGQQVRIFIRLDSDSSDVTFDKTYTATSTTMTKTCSGLEPDTTYAINVATLSDGVWMGKETFTTDPIPRPSNWSFTSTIQSGSPIELTAVEWNNFCTRINKFRDYCGVSQYSFTTVSKGTPISASVVNEARTAISGLSGHGTLPNKVYSGDPITADFFNTLKTALNSVP